MLFVLLYFRLNHKVVDYFMKYYCVYCSCSLLPIFFNPDDTLCSRRSGKDVVMCGLSRPICRQGLRIPHLTTWGIR